MEFDINNSRDLLLVNVNEKLYVVDAPTYEGCEGDLVEFGTGCTTLTGPVVDKMWCRKNEDTYRCMSHLHRIYPAKKIYKAMWSAEDPETT